MLVAMVATMRTTSKCQPRELSRGSSHFFFATDPAVSMRYAKEVSGEGGREGGRGGERLNLCLFLRFFPRYHLPCSPSTF